MRITTFVRAIVLVGGLGCGGGDSDTELPIETEDTFEGCRETSLFVDGPEAPSVGDSWSVLIKCLDDGAVLVGPMTVRVTPPDAARIEESTLTFLKAGEVKVRVQVGSYVETQTVVVGG
jgi:hypothetical protein